MALATRCPHCNTSFRVGAEQLALRDGLVRCGSCSHVFNGLEHLQEPDLPVLSEPFDTAPAAVAAPAIHLDLPEAGTQPETGSAPESDSVPETDSGSAPAAEPKPTTPSFNTHFPARTSAPWSALSSESPATGGGTPSPASAPTPGVLRQPSTDAPVVGTHGTSTFFSPPQLREPLTPGGLRHASRLEGLPDETADDNAILQPPPAGRDAAWRPAWQKPLPDGLNELDADPGPDDPDKAATAIGDEDRPWLHSQRRTWRRQSNDAHDTAAPLPKRASEESDPDTSWPAPASPVSPTQAPTAGSAAEPDFVRQARRRDHLGRPLRWVRLIALPLLLLIAVLQAIAAFPEQTMARLPWTAPLVEQACQRLDCETGPAMHINAITIEASELQAMASAKNTLVLTVWLHNGSTLAQSWPHLELTLNDFEEQALVRRVFTPAQYLLHDPAALRRDGLAAGARQTVRLLFELDALQAAGYRVYLFYP